VDDKRREEKDNGNLDDEANPIASNVSK